MCEELQPCFARPSDREWTEPKNFNWAKNQAQDYANFKNLTNLNFDRLCKNTKHIRVLQMFLQRRGGGGKAVD